MWRTAKADVQYLPLKGSLTDEASIEKSLQEASSRKFIRPWIIHVLLAIIWSIAFGIAFFRGATSSSCDNPDKHSPLSNTLHYSPRRFTSGLSDSLTPYQGAPNTQNAALWSHLTSTGIITLTATENSALPEPSVPFNTTTNTYLGAIEVFHQLHCLDMLRREVYHELDSWLVEHHSKKDKLEHLDHCVDFLRQSLMCRPSVEILPFRVAEETGQFKARFDGVHVCADFEAVREWAVKRQAGDLTP